MNLILAIESSCDETSIAILKSPNKKIDTYTELNQVEIINSVISSQVTTHAEYGGVIPEIGARLHADQIHYLIHQVVSKAKEITKLDDNLFWTSIQNISITTHPGLVSALRVGQETAKSLQFMVQKKYGHLISISKINHLHGHFSSSFFQQNDKSYSNQDLFPHLHLLVSGGNTQLILAKGFNDWEIIGQTLDDAAGECFDKTGRMLGLPYPAGIWISKIAGENNQNPLNLPIGMKNNQTLNFSYSGLKTACKYLVKDQKFSSWQYEKELTMDEVQSLNQEHLEQKHLKFIQQMCISIQSVIVAQLENRLKKALKSHQIKSIGLSGGVSANPLLRTTIQKIGQRNQLNTFISPRNLTGDNAVMIGLSGLLQD